MVRACMSAVSVTGVDTDGTVDATETMTEAAGMIVAAAAMVAVPTSDAIANVLQRLKTSQGERC
jgi:hypothetical protein